MCRRLLAVISLAALAAGKDYSYTIHNDGSIGNLEGAIHSWLSIDGPGKDVKYFSFSKDPDKSLLKPAPGISSVDDKLKKRSTTESFTRVISALQYDQLSKAMDSFYASKPLYQLLPDKDARNTYNCVTASHHVLSAAGINIMKGIRDPLSLEPTFAGYLQRFSLKTHWYLFHEQKVASYNVVKGFLVMWLALSATFLWNFTDLFIILVSASLAVQMRMFTTGLRAARGQILTNNEWREYREAYTLLSLLVKKVDAHINSIIILSVSSNVYFICAQLITEIDSIQHSYFRTLFYMYSTLFLVGRTTVVVMQAAAINDETKRIPTELYLCPQQSYCIETQRFLHEVTSDFVALTGLNMFYITRNFLLVAFSWIILFFKSSRLGPKLRHWCCPANQQS